MKSGIITMGNTQAEWTLAYRKCPGDTGLAIESQNTRATIAEPEYQMNLPVFYLASPCS